MNKVSYKFTEYSALTNTLIGIVVLPLALVTLILGFFYLPLLAITFVLVKAIQTIADKLTVK